ncbi:MAG: hypothetical protein OXU30_05895 [Gammaproteobacteria bacterium]|nr:hypothetical protein [Gammaproteobacteria bacterium]MDD9895162.1 hypothetical protein [Gammaproteobacteria bacterium]
MQEQENTSQQLLSPSDAQLTLAQSLELELAELDNLQDLIASIEARLGQATMLEQARWFLLSILCHANKATWRDIEQSGIAEQKQYELAQQFNSSDQNKQSLRRVLKEIQCRYTLINFAKARNLERRTLSTTTKAYKAGKLLLVQAGLIGEMAKPIRRKVAPESEDRSGSVVNRRAARRGNFVEEGGFLEPVEIHSPAPKQDREDLMSEEEFSELSEIIEGDGERVAPPKWTYPTNEDRLSLLMGLAAGGGVFVIALILFL